MDRQRREQSQLHARIDELEKALGHAQLLGDTAAADLAHARSGWAASQLSYEEAVRYVCR